jgi:hypothetical protein
MLSTRSQEHHSKPLSSRPILVRTLLVERSCATQAQRIRVLPPYPQRLSQMVGSLQGGVGRFGRRETEVMEITRSRDWVVS